MKLRFILTRYVIIAIGLTLFMDIQHKIGNRIATARKELRLTVRALAERTKTLKPSRISNWENGTRTPGPEEAIQLAQALEISPAYLLALTDDPTIGKRIKIPGVLNTIPTLDYQQSCNPLPLLQALKSKTLNQIHLFTAIGDELTGKIGDQCFALHIKDNSMEPEIKTGDFVIFDIDRKPNPGNFVIAKINSESTAIIRQYKQTSYSGEFELVALNKNWPGVIIHSKQEGQIIGVAVEVRHHLE